MCDALGSIPTTTKKNVQINMMRESAKISRKFLKRKINEG
jgi:hypothetical protein